LITAFTETGWDDYLYWQTNDSNILDRVNELIKEIRRDPFRGKGKPEPLQGHLSGFWSRRITQEHRPVYRVEGKKPNQMLVIIQARFHY